MASEKYLKTRVFIMGEQKKWKIKNYQCGKIYAMA